MISDVESTVICSQNWPLFFVLDAAGSQSGHYGLYYYEAPKVRSLSKSKHDKGLLVHSFPFQCHR